MEGFATNDFTTGQILKGGGTAMDSDRWCGRLIDVEEAIDSLSRTRITGQIVLSQQVNGGNDDEYPL